MVLPVKCVWNKEYKVKPTVVSVFKLSIVFRVLKFESV